MDARFSGNAALDCSFVSGAIVRACVNGAGGQRPHPYPALILLNDRSLSEGGLFPFQAGFFPFKNIQVFRLNCR